MVWIIVGVVVAAIAVWAFWPRKDAFTSEGPEFRRKVRRAGRSWQSGGGPRL